MAKKSYMRSGSHNWRIADQGLSAVCAACGKTSDMRSELVRVKGTCRGPLTGGPPTHAVATSAARFGPVEIQAALARWGNPVDAAGANHFLRWRGSWLECQRCARARLVGPRGVGRSSLHELVRVGCASCAAVRSARAVERRNLQQSLAVSDLRGGRSAPRDHRP